MERAANVKWLKPVLVGLAVLLVFAGGVGAGVWFTHNYRIVPFVKAPLATTSPHATPPDAALPSESEDAAASLTPRAAGHANLPPLPESPATAPNLGPFAYKFTPGELLRYRLEADVQGLGREFDETLGINMGIASDMMLRTDRVDARGNGELQLAFAAVDVQGVFMGSPFAMHQTPEGAQMRMDDRTLLDTDRGQSIGGIPQMEFFSENIEMTVAPDGKVIDLKGSPGLEEMLATSSMFAPVQFPSPEIPIGYQWETVFDMPVPGFGTAARSRAINTFQGYQIVNGRQCAVILQEFISEQREGTLDSPESALGESMGFTMPVFELVGQNAIFFDTENGHLVHSDMDLNLTLVIGEEMKAIGDLLNFYDDILSEMDGGRRPNLPGQEQQANPLLDIGVNIKGSLSLVDGAAPVVATAESQ